MYVWVFKVILRGFNDCTDLLSSLCVLASPQQRRKSTEEKLTGEKSTFVCDNVSGTQSIDLEALAYSFWDDLTNGLF